MGITAHRPWQLLMIDEGASHFTAKDVEALPRILDLFPHIGGLDVQTTAGPVRVSRDFSCDYTRQVDQLLTGITFPARAAQSAHTATPDDPHWSARG